MPPVQLISPRILQITLGIGSLLLPFALVAWVLAPFQVDDYFQPTMSEYIYTAAGPIFIGALFSIAVLFFSYQGYPGRAGRLPVTDRQVALVAAIGALMTGLFPSNTCAVAGGAYMVINPWDLPYTGLLHFVGATMLFGAGGWLSYFHFPLSDKINPNPRKVLRQKIHRACGLTILGLAILLTALTIIGVNDNCSMANQLSIIFFIEAAMTIAFALAWIVKAQVIFGDRDA